MKSALGKFLGLLLLGSMLSGCEMFNSSDEDEAEANPLVSFEETANIDVLWSTQIGDGTDGEFVRLQPALYRGVVYAADIDGEVYALDSETGKQKWQVDLEIPVSSGTYAGYGQVVVGTEKGEVVALSMEDGSELWRKKMTSEVLSVAAGDGYIVVIRTIDEKISGLDHDSGERVWIYENSQPVLSLRGTSDPVIEGGLVYVGFGNGSVKAISANNGVLRWEQTIGVPAGRTELDRMVDIDGSPLVDGGLVYAVGYRGNIVAMDAQRGTPVWKRKASSYEGLAAGFGYLYMSDDNGFLSALDKNSNSIIWQQKELEYRELGTPTVVSSYVAVADFAGYVHFLSQIDGSFVARTQVDSEGIRGRMLSVGNTLYIYGNSGELTALQIR